MKYLAFLFVFMIFGQVFSQDNTVSLTVYNDDLAVVKDVRILELDKGLNQISFTDVAAYIDPTSVHVKSIKNPGAIKVLEQNFEYDLVSRDRILEKYVDQEISVVTKESGFFEGLLLSASGGTIVLKMQDESIKMLSNESIISVDFPRLPEGLITKPTLVWKLNSTKKIKDDMEVSYLTSGIDWHAEYVAVVMDNDRSIDMNSWVSIDNQSGATYENARLKLVAGEVNRVREERVRALAKSYAVSANEMAAPQFEERSFFEYHLYELQGRTTVKDNQTKQISLFENAKASVKKIYVFDEHKYRQDVGVNLEFKNSKENGLGIPLPKGKVRVYKQDEKGDKSLEFIGEDLIDHTPKNEKVRIYLGNAFDLKAERKVVSQKRLGERAREESIEIKLRNHKESDEKILIVEHFWGNWTIKNASHDYVKKDAFTMEFNVLVPADKEVIVTYTVVRKW